MLLPDFCHKFLPGYVGGVQEGAVTPTGNPGSAPAHPRAAFPCPSLLRGLTPHPPRQHTHTHTHSFQGRPPEVTSEVTFPTRDRNSLCSLPVVWLGARSIFPAGTLGVPQGHRGALGLPGPSLPAVPETLAQPTESSWLPTPTPAPPAATGGPCPFCCGSSFRQAAGW